jgi:hypothetical protein
LCAEIESNSQTPICVEKDQIMTPTDTPRDNRLINGIVVKKPIITEVEEYSAAHPEMPDRFQY